MTLPYREEQLLRRVDHALCRSDPHLASLLSIFAQLNAAEAMPAGERLRPQPSWPWRVLLWPVAAIVFLAMFMVDGELRPAAASGAAMRRRTLCLCLRLLGRADGQCA